MDQLLSNDFMFSDEELFTSSDSGLLVNFCVCHLFCVNNLDCF